jgi:hypothetical protein
VLIRACHLPYLLMNNLFNISIKIHVLKFSEKGFLSKNGIEIGEEAFVFNDLTELEGSSVPTEVRYLHDRNKQHVCFFSVNIPVWSLM